MPRKNGNNWNAWQKTLSVPVTIVLPEEFERRYAHTQGCTFLHRDAKAHAPRRQRKDPPTNIST